MCHVNNFHNLKFFTKSGRKWIDVRGALKTCGTLGQHCLTLSPACFPQCSHQRPIVWVQGRAVQLTHRLFPHLEGGNNKCRDLWALVQIIVLWVHLKEKWVYMMFGVLTWGIGESFSITWLLSAQLVEPFQQSPNSFWGDESDWCFKHAVDTITSFWLILVICLQKL